MSELDAGKSVYESWVRDYGAGIYRCALRLCGHADCADDLTQEVFYEAWRSMNSLRDARKARVWLMGILQHRYMHWLRDEKRRPRSNAAEHARPELLSSGEELPHETMARQESLQAALNELDDRYKMPFLLVFLEGLTCQQAAEFMDLPLGTVLSRIHRARLFLREHLQEKERVPGTLRLRRDQPDEGEPPRAVGGER